MKLMDTLRQDIKYAWRHLLRSPGFTTVAVVTLALGIGANSAIFSVVNAVLLKPLPYAEPERLVGLYHLSEGHREVDVGSEFHRPPEGEPDTLGCGCHSRVRVDPDRPGGAGASRRRRGQRRHCSTSLASGRRSADVQSRREQPGRNKVAILSLRAVAAAIRRRPEVVGRTIMLDGVSTEVVGVMPEGFSYPAARVLWTPIEYTEDFTTSQRAAGT